MGDIPSIIGSR